MVRESLLISTIVELADNLVDEFDVIDVLTVLSLRCVDAIDVDAAGVMLAPPGGELQFVASSSEAMRMLELFQIQADEGPCVDCYRTGGAIINKSLRTDDTRWPNFTPRAIAQGFRAVHCLPLRLRGSTIGALNLFSIDRGPMSTDDAAIAQGLADVATIAIMQYRIAADAKLLNDQLSSALNSRIVIEQAKGMIAQHFGIEMVDAFDKLRAHSRNHNLGLSSVATAVVHGELDVADLDSVAPGKQIGAASPS